MVKYIAIKIAIGGKTGIVQVFDMFTPDTVKAGVGYFTVTAGLNIAAVW